MTLQSTDDLRIKATRELLSPKQLLAEYPMTEAASQTVFDARSGIQNILRGNDDRLFVIVGPCSIHDPKAALEYAERLAGPMQDLKDELLIVMRVYFEKPRTTVGWKGLINDPKLDDSFQINEGLRTARNLLLELANKGIPAGTEYLDLISPQYVADLISWGAIGARTTESQCHRELASGLSCPVGFKNGTTGDVQIAIDAIGSASHSHHFLSVTKEGHSAIFQTGGNEDCHIILRGGHKHTNYDPENVGDVSEKLDKAGLRPNIVIDCSHANSNKDPGRQIVVCRDVAYQVANGENNIKGIMLESHLLAGNQKVVPGQELTYGQSITDACMAWDDTAGLLAELADSVKERRKN
ncbi:MAG: 3-deoxy-7-phosphoheptulonate synthase [Gammaproteobacteria bacterium]|jgi:3-deoxy-7-phosphoheptulonate synthase|nr:3-deoxy-7-phosphoheptulonate synthase [Gammaproteobacteria bacterium]MBT6044026.1 3-deoxy-7-phosphoheptulonate synthase [Gammaproteobacteria bacterium]